MLVLHSYRLGGDRPGGYYYTDHHAGDYYIGLPGDRYIIDRQLKLYPADYTILSKASNPIPGPLSNYRTLNPAYLFSSYGSNLLGYRLPTGGY